MQVRDVLARKGSGVTTIAPTATVTDLVAMLSEQRIGAVVVTADGSTIDGIVSERDVAQALHTHGSALPQLPVSELMTKTVRTCTPDDKVREVARVMTEGRFRHLPVLDGAALAGIVSIGDIVKNRIDELETEADHLVGYLFTA